MTDFEDPKDKDLHDLTPEEAKAIYGVDVCLPDYEELESAREGEYYTPDYDLWTCLYDKLVPGHYPWGWDEFHKRIPWWRIKIFYEILQKKIRSDMDPVSWNEFAFMRVMGKFMTAFLGSKGSSGD